jgi:hypothetical protein
MILMLLEPAGDTLSPFSFRSLQSIYNEEAKWIAKNKKLIF